jgi:O-antigen/teichoic acid export membrane protein
MFGLMGICMVLIRGLDLFTETGISAALIHRQGEVERAKNTAYTLQVLRGIGLALLTWALAPFAAAYYDEPLLQSLTFWLAIGLAGSGFVNVDMILLWKKLDFRRITTLDMTVAILSTFVIVGLALALRSVWALVIGQLVTTGLRVALSYIIVPSRPKMEFDRRIAGELLSYGRYITGLTTVLFITSEIDNVFVAKLLGLEALGLYTMAYALANLPATHISKVASTVVLPAYSSLQNDLATLRVAYLTMVRLAGGIALPAAVGLAVLAPDVVHIVYGDKWMPMVPVLRVLTLFGAARAIGGLSGSMFNAIGKPNLSLYVAASKLSVILMILYPATKAYGLIGAAAAVAAPQVAGEVLGLFLVQRQIHLPASSVVSALARILMACGAMAGAVLTLRAFMGPVGVPQFIALVVCGVVSYGVLRIGEARSLYAELTNRRGRPASGPAVAPAL